MKQFLASILFVSLCLPTWALEMTASPSSHKGADSSYASRAVNAALSSQLKNILICNKKHGFYDPEHADADGDGCVVPVPPEEAEPAEGALCGIVFWETRSNGWLGNVQNRAACKGVQLMAGNGSESCPTDYVFKNIHYNWGRSGGYVFQYHTGTCVYAP